MVKKVAGAATRLPIRNLPVDTVPLQRIEDVKTAVLALANTATRSVVAVRAAFASGIAPYQVAGSGSAASYVASFSSDKLGSNIVRSTSRMGLSTSTAGSSVQLPKPELDDAEIVEGPGGVLDQFSIKLTFSLPEEKLSRAKLIKIMRAKLGAANVTKPSFSALMFAPITPGIGVDRGASSAFRIAEVGVGNKLTSFVTDSLSGRGASSPDSQSLRPSLPSLNTNRGDTNTGLLSIKGADRSVVENISFYANRLSIGAVGKPSIDEISIRNSTGINVLKGGSVATLGAGIVQGPNPMNFSTIALVDMTGPSVRKIGDFVEGSFVDKTVVYGTSFAYYILCVDENGTEGPRSKIINVSVTRSIPPKQPTVGYSVIGSRPRFTIKCEAGCDHVEIFRSGRAVLDSIRLGSENSLVTHGPATKVGQFWHINDVGIGPDGSTTFVDAGVFAGDRLSYRIYSVDPYGLKCQTPFSCSINMPDNGQSIPIPVPSITVEQITGLPYLSVKMAVDDPRVAGFVIQRRDLTIKERSVHQANQPEWVDLGNPGVKRFGSRKGPTLIDAEWPLYIPATGTSASFVDTTVRLDRKYQYAVGAIDKRGNKTLLVGSNPVGVYTKAIIEAPTGFAASIKESGGIPTSVLLSWNASTNDFAPSDIVGDQDVLSAFKVRSVFQVERREKNVPFWNAMPATSESYFIDRVDTAEAPVFRPPYVIPGNEYEYRVSAMQSGGFISPRSDVVHVSVLPMPIQPKTVWVRSTSLSVNPFSIIVSWDMGSNFVERWEIERAVTNKVFGERVTSMDSKLALGLNYVRVAEITPEASRARGISSDVADIDRGVYVGNRFYVDSDVSRANSYFYRIRTVGSLGSASEWSSAGVLLKDSSFDRKMFSTLSDDVKVNLTNDRRAIITKRRT